MESFEQLVQNLTDATQPIGTRRAAVTKIAEIDNNQALPFLINALSDPAPSVRREAANVLQQYNFREAVPVLLRALEIEDNDLTRWTFIGALGHIGTAAALPVLQALSNTESALTRRVVQKSIDQIIERHPAEDTAKVSETDSYRTADISDQQTERQNTYTEKPENSVENAFEKNIYDLDGSGSGDTEKIEPENVDEQVSEDSTLFSSTNEGVSDRTEETSTTDSRLGKSTLPPPFRIKAHLYVEDVVEEDAEDTENTTAPGTEQNVATSETRFENFPDEAASSDTTFAEPSVDAEISDTPNAQAPEPDTEDDTITDAETQFEKRPEDAAALPVLVPNTSVVMYGQEKTALAPSIFAIMLRPGRYLSKQWVSRTRLYLILCCLLTAAAITLIYSQVQRQTRSPYTTSFEIEFVGDPQRYLDEGDFHFQQGNYRRAIEAYELIRAVDTLAVDFYKNLGSAYFHENRYALAVEAYEFFLEAQRNQTVEPFIAEASNRSSLYRSEVQRISDNYKIYNALGTAYLHLGDFHKAYSAYKEAIALAPNEAEAYSNLAHLYSEGYQQKPRLAEALAHTAVRLNPDVARYHAMLGRLLSKRGQVNKAISTLERAIRLQSDYLPAYYHLTEAALKSKQPKKAFEAVQKLVQLNPAFLHQRELTQ